MEKLVRSMDEPRGRRRARLSSREKIAASAESLFRRNHKQVAPFRAIGLLPRARRRLWTKSENSSIRAEGTEGPRRVAEQSMGHRVSFEK